jgi:predicted transcriptional regulator
MVTKKQQREVLSLLEESDKTHEELLEEMDQSFDTIQSIIRVLRRSRKVSITLDRRYTKER